MYCMIYTAGYTLWAEECPRKEFLNQEHFPHTLMCTLGMHVKLLNEQRVLPHRGFLPLFFQLAHFKGRLIGTPSSFPLGRSPHGLFWTFTSVWVHFCTVVHLCPKNDAMN